MGIDHRRRRAAEQRQRDRDRRARSRSGAGPSATAGTRPGGPDPVDGEFRLVLTRLVYAAVDAVRAKDRLTLDEAVRYLEEDPDGRALVDDVLGEVDLQQRRLAFANGWSDDDLSELLRRRAKAPAAAGDVERQLRVIALIAGLPRLPEAQERRAPSDDGVDAGMLAKIRALLAKAESTTFPEEAESLSAKAQELMTRHRIDHALVGGGADGEQPVGRRVWLDDPYADAKAQLLGVVAGANGCRSVVLGRLGVSHLVGFAADLDLTELLHTSLLVQATRAMAAAGPQTDRRGRSRTRSFRQSFLVAYAWRIGQRLREASAATQAEVDAEHGGNVLPVLARREADVEEVMAQAFPHTRPMRLSASNGAGWAAGAAAADLADLSVGQPLPRRRLRLA